MSSIIYTNGMCCVKCSTGIYAVTPVTSVLYGNVQCSCCGNVQPIKMTVKTFKQLVAEKNPEYLYRIDGGLTGSEEWFEVKIWFNRYRIVERTPKGAWITVSEYRMSKDKFVLLTAVKQYACRTEEEAKVSFEARKKRQIGILTSQLDHAKRALLLSQQNLIDKRFL